MLIAFANSAHWGVEDSPYSSWPKRTSPWPPLQVKEFVVSAALDDPQQLHC